MCRLCCQDSGTAKYVLTPEQWSIDLSSPDKLLTVKADVPAEKVVEAVRAAGFKAELL